MLALLCGATVSCIKQPEGVEASFRDLTWAVGTPLPKAEDFAVSLPEGATVRFAENYTYPSLGEYQLKLIVTDAQGRESEYSVRFSLVQDTQAPIVSGAKDLSVIIGDGVSYRAGVEVTDNCDGQVKLEIDSSAEQLGTEGSYPVIYKATDAAGNVTTVKITVWVYRERVTEEMLFAEIDRLIDLYVSAGASAQKQAEQVYDYVYSRVAYDVQGEAEGKDYDKTDWVRTAYLGIRTGLGDCFTYFALSKAFFIRLGIESMDIKRIEGICEQRHYWNYVNIGTAENPRWYHFDACHINHESKGFGLFLTDAQVDAYTATRTMEENGVTVSHFWYAYDKSLYPKSATEKINPSV